MGEAAFFHVVITSAVAQHTGRDLAASESAVAAMVDRLPYSARGWLCLMYKASGKRDEAEGSGGPSRRTSRGCPSGRPSG